MIFTDKLNALLNFKDKMYLFFQTYTKDNGFIVTQYPTEDNVVELIRLMVDYGCRTIICLNPQHNYQISTCYSESTLPINNHWLLHLLLVPLSSQNCSLYFPTYYMLSKHLKFIQSSGLAKIINFPIGMNQLRIVCGQLNVISGNWCNLIFITSNIRYTFVIKYEQSMDAITVIWKDYISIQSIQQYLQRHRPKGVNFIYT